MQQAALRTLNSGMQGCLDTALGPSKLARYQDASWRVTGEPLCGAAHP